LTTSGDSSRDSKALSFPELEVCRSTARAGAFALLAQEPSTILTNITKIQSNEGT